MKNILSATLAFGIFAAPLGMGLMAVTPFAVAQTTSGPDRMLPDGGPPGFSQRYDRGANEVPDSNAPPLEGRSVYSPSMDREQGYRSNEPAPDAGMDQ